MLREIVTGKNTRTYVIIVAVSLGLLLNNIQSSGGYLILNPVMKEFQTDLATVSLLATANAIVITALMVICGKLADYKGAKKVFMIGYGCFLVCTLFCGISWDIWSLVFFRIFQAVGVALMFASFPVLLILLLPESSQGTAFALVTAVMMLGYAIGSGLGVIVADTGWRWLFLSCVPPGLVGLILAQKFLQEPDQAIKKPDFDIPGAIYIVITLGVLLTLLAVIDLPYMSDLMLGILLLVGIIFMGICLDRFLHVPSPILDLRILKNRFYSIPLVDLFVVAVFSAIVAFIFPVFLIEEGILDSMNTGILLMVSSFFTMIGSIIAGLFTDKYGVRRMCLIGMALLFISIFLLASLPMVNPTLETIMLLSTILFLSRFSIGFLYGPLSLATMDNCPRDSLGSGSGIMMTVRCSAGVVGVVFVEILIKKDLFKLMAETDLFFPLLTPLINMAGFQRVFMIGSIFVFAAFLFAFFIRGKSKPS